MIRLGGSPRVDERRWRVLLAVDVAIKAATVVLLLIALSLPELPQFQGKAFAGRAIAYPIALGIVPVVWLLLRRPIPYPVVPDILFGLPFLIDMVGNALGLYDSVEWWDDANHLVNWWLHTAAIAILLAGTPAAGCPRRARDRMGGVHRDPVGAGRVRDVRPRLGRSVNRVRGHARRPRPGAPGRNDCERADRVAAAGSGRPARSRTGSRSRRTPSRGSGGRCRPSRG